LLDKRADSMSAFGDMLDARRARYRSRQPLAATDVNETRLQGMQARHDEMTRRLSLIRQTGDVMQLATRDEAAIAQRLQIVESNLDERPELAFQSDRKRFLEGVLYWQIHSDFPRRLRTSEKINHANGRVIDEIQARIDKVEKVCAAEPPRFDEFANRIDIASQNLRALRSRTTAVMLAQSEYLGDLAITELMARQERVADYLGQARFALAASYDRAAVAEVLP
jgi:hypothetical protein